MFCLFVFLFVWSSCMGFNFSPQPNLVFREPKLKVFQKIVRSSYFGYSVNLRTSSIIVGAPRAQSHLETQRNINETGAIYKCTLNTGTCAPYVFDALGNIFSEGDQYTYNNEKKDHQWMGGSMDGGSKDTDKLIVCAPRLIANLEPNDYLIHGVCYWTKDTLTDQPNAMKISPLKLKSKQVKIMKNNNKRFHHMFGEQGISVHLSDNNEEFIIGAPGIDTWKGSVIRSRYKPIDDIGGLSRRRRDTIKFPVSYEFVNEDPDPTEQSDDSYFGYSVSSGYYNSSDPEKLLYLGSAPQADSQSGEAYIFDIEGVGEYNIRKLFIFHGTKFGEYFGYSVLTEDVNGDGLLDVIISAPQFWTGSQNYEIGAIYVYINRGKLTFEIPKIIISPSTTQPGRFGSTLTRLGDINHDGYNDIAVGAPFDQNGSVFIYLGGSKGLREIHSQILKPPLNVMNLSPSAGRFMFGHGLSKGVDIDFNTYNDFAIGAPNAEMVYLYRAYPVVKVIASVNANREITTSQNTIEISTCYGINTTSAIHEKQELNIKLIVDPKVNRAYFDKTGSPVLEYNVLATSTINCDFHKVNVNFTISDIFKPIELQMHYEVVNKVPTNSQIFCENCVAVDPADDTMAAEKIIFSTGCRSEVCVADLKVSSVNLNKNFILGSSRVLTVEYEIENKGETAFLPQINFTSSTRLDFNRIPTSCNQIQNGILLCNLFNGRHMLPGAKDRIKVDYDVSNLKGDVLKLTAEAFSTGKEAFPIDNIIRDVIKLSQYSELEIIQSSIPNNINLEEFSNQIDITNSFDIKNVGPSHIEDIVLAFYVPVAYMIPDTSRTINIININNLTADANFDGKNLEMQIQNNFIEASPSILNFNPKFEQMVHRGYKSSSFLRKRRDLTATRDEYLQIRKNKNIESDLMGSLPLNRTVIFSCNQHELIQCVRFLIKIDNFQVDREKFILFKTKFSLNLQEINEILYEDFEFFVIETSIKVINEKDYNGNTIKLSQNFLYNIISKHPYFELPWWIILLSIILGLLILGTLTYGLKKCGFFKRNKPKLQGAKSSPGAVPLTRDSIETETD
ncbi:ITGA9.2 family protein [Megaselia abdita]